MPSVAHPRGDLSDEARRSLTELANKRRNAEATTEAATEALRLAVLSALEAGGSFRAIHEATGVSTTTLQRWKREA